MLFAIGMTAQAAVFARSGRFAVAGMTAIAGRVLCHLVQPRELRGLMAGLALGRRCDTCRPVWTMAIGAGRCHFAMRGARLLRVTRRTGLGGGTRMRLVAIAASLVTCRSRALLRLVAAAACRPDTAAVRLVARRAFGVTLVGVSALIGMARAAASDSELRPMREPLVTPFTGLVAR
jgi:hypothetical protein